MNSVIRTIAELQQATIATYLIGIALAVLFVFLLMIFANLIQWKPGKFDNSGTQRKMVFYILLGLSFLTPWVVNYFLFYSKIAVVQFKTSYLMHMGGSAVVTTLLYVFISVLIIKLQKKDSKLASIFPKNN